MLTEMNADRTPDASRTPVGKRLTVTQPDPNNPPRSLLGLAPAAGQDRVSFVDDGENTPRLLH
jgi:hypothetical protein